MALTTGARLTPLTRTGSADATAAALIDTGMRLRISPGLPVIQQWPIAPSQDWSSGAISPHLSTLPWLSAVLDRIRLLSGLAADWDRQGAQPITENTVSLAISLIQYFADQSLAAGFLLQRPSVSPSPAGSIGFEWECESTLLTIECSGTSHFHLFLCTDAQEVDLDVGTLPALWAAVRDTLHFFA